MKNFALTGAAGFVAPRHMEAIQRTGNRLVAAFDPKDSVGVLDRYAPAARFFTEAERFDRWLEKQRRGPEEERVHYLAVCSPNYLHDAHCRLGLRAHADVICEKPLVINPWNLEPLEELERETGRRVWTMLQLRTHDAVAPLREKVTKGHDVDVTYVTPRGPWYDVSWKGQDEKSGGVPTNIGIHVFDLVRWLFGPAMDVRVELAEPRRCAGVIELECARVRWLLSVDARDAQDGPRRSLRIDGSEIDLSEGFDDLHTRVYERTLAGRGFGIADARPSIELVHRIRTAARALR